MYENVFGLSCVENQVLAILRQHNERIEYGYYDSAVPLRDLYTDLVEKGIKQEYFSRIERIQNVLKKLDIIEFVKIETVRFDDVKQAVYLCKENEYILIRVTPHFSKTNLMARGFRPDHFVHVRMSGNGFKVFNDIPERIILVTSSQLKESFDGEYFRLTVKRNLSKEDSIHLWNIRKFRPEKFGVHPINVNNFENIDNVGIKLRNLVGVYKLLRYRMFHYYGNYLNTEFIAETMPRIEKIYAMLEYYNLKSGVSIDKYVVLFSRLYEMDILLMRKLSKEMECLRIDEGKN